MNISLSHKGSIRQSTIILISIIVLTVFSLIPSRSVLEKENELLMTVWGMPFEDALFRDGYARGFEERKPGWSVRYQRHSDLVDKYNAWHVKGFGADVMRLPIDYYQSFVAKGMLMPLNELINDPELGLTQEELNDYVPIIMDQLRMDGEIYALPSDNAQLGLYYNRTAFDNYNSEHPDSPLTYPDKDWTWDDLRHAAKVLTIIDESTGSTSRYGVMFDLWAWPFMTFFAQAGGELWDEDETTTLINSEAGVEALEYIREIIPSDAPIRAVNLAASAASPAELFKSGRLALLIDGSWRAPNIEIDNPSLDFVIAPLPHHKKRAVVSGSVLWAISAHSKHKREAWEMVKWIAGYEQSQRYWDVLRVAPPALSSVIHSEEFKTTTGLVEYGKVRVPPMSAERFQDRAAWLSYAITPDPETGETPGFVISALYQNDLNQKLTTALIRATRGEMSPRDALEAAAREVHEIIDRDRRAKGLPAIDRD